MKFSLTIVLLVILVLVDMVVGTTGLTLSQIAQALAEGPQASSVSNLIVWDIRLPRVAAAILAGMGLSISGLLMQTLFRNPIAGPYVLGVSSGAGLGAALLIFGFGIFGLQTNSSLAMVFAACLGAAMVLLAVLLISRWVKDFNTILILGMLFGASTSGIIAILEQFGSPEALRRYTLWTFGSLSGITRQDLPLLIIPVVLAVFLALRLARQLDVLLLGEQKAYALGLSIKSVQQQIILITGLATGVVTAFCGPLAFVGIAVPHLARWVFKTANHRVLLVQSAIIGAIVLLLSDIITQVAPGDGQLPLNAVAALLGVPVVIWVVLRGSRG